MKKKRIIRRIWKRISILSISLLFVACAKQPEVYLEAYVTEVAGLESQASEISDDGKYLQTMTDTAAATEEPLLCYVYICGAVLHPDVYALPEGSRIYEVVEMAGGLLEEADVASVNQAEVISDGQMIRIYTYEESQNGLLSEDRTAEEKDVKPDDGRVNINTASQSELMTLPGIGESKATAIVAYRESNGAFSSIEELMNIPGIKEGIFLQLKEHIKIN